jgi:hypothetical protein
MENTSLTKEGWSVPSTQAWAARILASGSFGNSESKSKPGYGLKVTQNRASAYTFATLVLRRVSEVLKVIESIQTSITPPFAPLGA